MCSQGKDGGGWVGGRGEAVSLAAVLPGSQGGLEWRLGAGGEEALHRLGGGALTSALLEVLRIHQDHSIWRKDSEVSRPSQFDLSNS